MFGWLREFLEIRNEFRRSKVEIKTEETVCKSCETLKQQLEIANYEKSELLKKILKTPEAEPERVTAPELVAPRPRMVDWRARRQMLESEDREKAKLLRKAPKPASEKLTVNQILETSVEDLEKELGVTRDATEEAAGQAGTK